MPKKLFSKIKEPKLKFFYNEEPQTYYTDQLKAIRVKCFYAPSYKNLLNFIPEFGTAIWEYGLFQDVPREKEERKKIVKDLFDGKILPTALECINMVFRISGIDFVDVTHLIRYRSFSFSAQGTGDRDLRHDVAVVKPSILNHHEFSERYKQLVKDSKRLYADMIDSKEINQMDARTVLPRGLGTFYWVRGNLKDLIAYVKQRIDEQIQPVSDNIVALLLWREIVKRYPILHDKIEIENAKDLWYINTYKAGESSNYFPPKPANDVFDWHPDSFVYKEHRDEMLGGLQYLKRKEEIIKQIKRIGEKYESSKIDEDGKPTGA